jgi:hypothetical protein
LRIQTSYLRCYLGLADDDWRCILEDESLPHYLTRVEELVYIRVVRLERLAILLRQGVEGRLDDIMLIEVRSVDVGAFFLHA